MCSFREREDETRLGEAAVPEGVEARLVPEGSAKEEVERSRSHRCLLLSAGTNTPRRVGDIAPGIKDNRHVESIKVACVQAEPVVLDREATLDKLGRGRRSRRPREGARLLVFPEAFIPVYPSSVWAKALRRLGRSAREGRVRAARARVRRRARAGRRPARRDRPRARRLARHRRHRARPRAARHALQHAALPRARRAASRSGTASSCRRTTSGSSGARATAAACARSRPTSAASAA